MLGSEKKFKIKVIPASAVSKFCFHHNLFAFKEFFCIETKSFNIFKTAKAANLTKAILKSSCKVKQITTKCKTLKLPVYF